MGKGNFKLEVVGMDPELVEAVARKVIELTGQEIKSPEEVLYTVEQVANITKVSIQTVRNHIKNGVLEAHKVGHPWQIKESNLKNYMNGK